MVVGAVHSSRVWPIRDSIHCSCGGNDGAEEAAKSGDSDRSYSAGRFWIT